MDPDTGYRYYTAHQLSRLHRLLALRDLGLTLDQIAPVLDDQLTVEELRGMLRLRRYQIEAVVGDEQARLRRVEAHLHALEGSDSVDLNDIVIKQTQPVRIAETAGTAARFGSDNVKPVFSRLLPKVRAHLERAGMRPGVLVAYYEWPAEDETMVVHVGYDVGAQDSLEDGTVKLTSLPILKVASVIHRGRIDEIVATFEALVRWIEDSGHRLAGPGSRELDHEWHNDNPDRNVTELQIPIA